MIISLLNHKNGNGKSTSCYILGQALKEAGYRVLMIDAAGSAGLTKAFDLPNIFENNASYFQQGDNIEDIIVSINGLDIIPNASGLGGYVEPTNPFNMRFGSKYTFQEYDYVLIDCASVVNNVVINALVASHFAIIPFEGHDNDSNGVNQTMQTINQIQNKYNPDLALLGLWPVKQMKNTSVLNNKYYQFSNSIKYFKPLQFSDNLADINIELDDFKKGVVHHELLVSEVVEKAIINV